MKRKTLLILIIICFVIASYASCFCRNEFANVIAAFICLGGLVCCSKLLKLPEPYWDDPLWDGTDAAHPAYWRGEEKSAFQFCRLINDVLSGKNKCKGSMQEPLESVRNSVFKLKHRYEALDHQRLALQSERDKLQKRNDVQAKTIHKYINGDARVELLNQIDKLFNKIGDLELEVKKLQNALINTCLGNNADRAALSLNCVGLKTELHNALEQRKADWDRIHSLEREVDNLKFLS